MARTPRTAKKGRTRETWYEPYLTALAAGGNVLLACRSAKVGRRTVYDHRSRFEDFAAEWDAALEEAAEVLEAEAWRRATKGVEEPVHYKGVRVDTIRKYSDTLLIFLLKGNNPAKFAGLDEKRLAQLIADALEQRPTDPSSSRRKRS